MNNKQKKGFMHNVKLWLPNIYYTSTLITLFFIMAQVFYAKRMMERSSEWEKAKMTIENIERFQNNLSTTVLYKHPDALQFATQRLWPDFSKRENRDLGDTLRIIYYSNFDDYDEAHKKTVTEEDLKKTLFALDAFAYPIIMGYANEFGSYQNVFYDYISYGNYILFMVYNYGSNNIGHNAKLLYRLWRVRLEQELVKSDGFDEKFISASVTDAVNYLLCFEGTETSMATKKQYEKKLKKELKKIQNEIEEFRKISLN